MSIASWPFISHTLLLLNSYLILANLISSLQSQLVYSLIPSHLTPSPFILFASTCHVLFYFQTQLHLTAMRVSNLILSYFNMLSAFNLILLCHSSRFCLVPFPPDSSNPFDLFSVLHSSPLMLIQTCDFLFPFLISPCVF